MLSRKTHINFIKKNIFAILLLAIMTPILLALFSNHILREDINGNLMTGESTYGDLPFHLSSISQMAYGDKIPPDNPLFAGRRLVYPYFVNVISASLVKAGMSLRNSIILPGILFSVVMILLLYKFYLAVSKDKQASFLGVLIFFFYSGLGFVYFFEEVVLKGDFTKYLINPQTFSEYSHVFAHNIQWCNFLTRIIVPERSVLLGIPMGIIILYLLFLRKNKYLDIWVIVASVLMGLLPFSHTHTFIVLAIVVPLWALMELQKKKRDRKDWLIKWGVFGSISLLIALPQLLMMIDKVSESSSFVRFRIGWMSEPGIQGFLGFWLKNAGVLLILFGSFFFLKNKEKDLIKLSVFSIILFVLANVAIFQPYDWDNIKILFWFGIFASIIVAKVLVEIKEKLGAFGAIALVILFLLLTLSGFISLYREVNVQYMLFSKDDVQMGIWVRDNTPAESVFITAPIHNSFVNNIGGRSIYMGYPGLLWVHGIDYSERESFTKSVYSGLLEKEILVAENIDYIIIGPAERADFNVDDKVFDDKYCLVKLLGNYKIYLVNCD